MGLDTCVRYNFTVAEGLVSSRNFAQAYLSLLDTSGSRLQWLDDEPRWVARLLHNHSRGGGGVGWRDSEAAGNKRSRPSFRVLSSPSLLPQRFNYEARNRGKVEGSQGRGTPCGRGGASAAQACW